MWVASGAMMLCSWLSYVDRQILAVLSPTILHDVHLNAQSYGEIVSAFSIAYMLANPIWGAVLDYIGLRLGMLAAVAIWTVASASHAWMVGFAGFALCRGLLGLGEGATFPGGFRASIDSLPKDRQARGMAISYSGGSLGAIFAPVVVVPVAAAFGWRAAFLVTGGLGLLWMILWAFVARPPMLPKMLPKSKEKPTLASLNPLEKRFWALIASYSLGSVAIGPVFYLSPLYLNRVMHLSQTDLGKVLWIPPLGWEIGYFAWGWIFDRFAPGEDRPVKMFLLLAVCMLPFAFMASIDSTAGCAGDVLLVHVRHRWIPDAGLAHRRAGVSRRQDGERGGRGLGGLGGRSRRDSAAHGPVVRSGALRLDFLGGGGDPDGGRADVDRTQSPRAGAVARAA